MIKRVGLLFLSLLLVLTGCLGKDELEKEEKVVQEKGKKEEKAIITGESILGKSITEVFFHLSQAEHAVLSVMA